MSQREELAQSIIASVKKRLRINLRLNVVDDIVIRFSRTEMLELSGKARIWDESVGFVMDKLRAELWHVDTNSKDFYIITVPVRALMTSFSTLESLREWNTKHSGILAAPAPKRPPQQQAQA